MLLSLTTAYKVNILKVLVGYISHNEKKLTFLIASNKCKNGRRFIHYLRQNAGEVCGARAVPEECPVVQRAELPEALALAVPRDLEDLLDAELVEVVRRGVRVLHVLLQRFELARLAVQNLKLGKEC